MDPSVGDPLCLVVEFCNSGDLLGWVRKRKPLVVSEKDPESIDLAKAEVELPLKTLLSFAWQISDGMVFMSNQGLIHRDLAARNVLIHNNEEAKIGDFGLCRLSNEDVYLSRGGRLPIKWMAPESLLENKFSSATDVWSYAVILYEMYSLGKAPFPRIQPADMTDHLIAGGRMEQPELCPAECYQAMLSCWEHRPENRPNFGDVSTRLQHCLQFLTDDKYGYLDVQGNRNITYFNVNCGFDDNNGNTEGKAAEENRANEGVSIVAEDPVPHDMSAVNQDEKQEPTKKPTMYCI